MPRRSGQRRRRHHGNHHLGCVSLIAIERQHARQRVQQRWDRRRALRRVACPDRHAQLVAGGDQRASREHIHRHPHRLARRERLHGGGRGTEPAALETSERSRCGHATARAEGLGVLSRCATIAGFRRDG